jgi:two-component system sensor histidine kinase UhpB
MLRSRVSCWSAGCQGVDETRRVLKALRASPLDDLGLRLSIRELATAAAEAAGVQLELTLEDDLPLLPLHIEQGIYRIAQEALANITHHAGATRLWLSLACEDAMVRLSISDDGRGFDAGAPG